MNASRFTSMALTFAMLVPAPVTAWSGADSSPESPAPFIGVSSDPCVGVPVQPTAAHQAAKDTYDAWMGDWLALDWSQRCRYQAENAALPPAGPTRVVLLGDSITEGWKELHGAWFSTNRIDRGISGQVTEQMLVRMRDDVISLRPTLVHIMAGTNDVAGNRGPTSLERIEATLATMAELARAHGIQVALASIPPAAAFPWQPELQPATDVRKLNAWLRDYARRERFIYVDYTAVLDDGHGGLKKEYSEDGVHPNAAGYAAMEPVFEAAIAPALAGSR